MSIFLSLALWLAAPPDTLSYDLTKPDAKVIFTGEELREISGLSPTDDPDVFLAIADERGEVYSFRTTDGTILQRIPFRDKGDFEAVEWIGKSLYVLKSNGDVFEIENWKKGRQRVNQYETPLNKEDDIEGVTFDLERCALLIACKGNPDSSTRRAIYAFDLRTKKLDKQPIYTIDPLEINRLVPYSEDDKSSFFSPSAVALHPQTLDIYVLSTSLKRMVVLDYATGAVRQALRLDKKILPQPEGIAFDAAGNLYIASEGKDGPGFMLRFNRQTRQ